MKSRRLRPLNTSSNTINIEEESSRQCLLFNVFRSKSCTRAFWIPKVTKYHFLKPSLNRMKMPRTKTNLPTNAGMRCGNSGTNSKLTATLLQTSFLFTINTPPIITKPFKLFKTWHILREKHQKPAKTSARTHQKLEDVTLSTCSNCGAVHVHTTPAPTVATTAAVRFLP